MKCTKRLFTVLCIVLAVPLSLSIGRFNARDADDALEYVSARTDR